MPLVKQVRSVLGWFRSRWFRDFDYRRAYRQADLSRDYWSIVGPGSREEFEKLGRTKFELLLAEGLTPRSRVLDVGCGTGQLTGVLIDFLSSEGLYHGTDIAPEAIAYCREHFSRPNFHFHVNAMTQLGLEGLLFDMGYLGSVLTHLYPDEIEILLRDARRSMIPKGKIIADGFVTRCGPAFSGHRGMVRIHENNLVERFSAAGLQSTVIQRWSWQRGVERVIYRLCPM